MKAKRIEVKEGSVSVPIYRFSDGRFCVDTLVGKKRRRITRASLDAAKIEARKMLFRNYRELVTEQQAAEWFGVLPERQERPKGVSVKIGVRAA